MRHFPYAVDKRPGNYYVSAVDGNKTVMLLGPFTTHLEALESVDDAKNEAYRVDIKAHWYAYGTCRTQDEYSKSGVLNYLLPLPVRAKPLPANIPNRRIHLGEEKRLTLDPTRPYDIFRNPIVKRTWRVVGRPTNREQSELIWIEPVGSDGYQPGPKLLHMRYWENPYS